MGRIFLLAFVAMVSACTSDPPVPAKPKGTYQWRNDELYSQNLSESQLEAKFQSAKNTCKIQSLSVPVPSPSCTQVPKNCSSYGPGAAQGMCQATPNYQTCNYSSVDAAYSAQDQILKSCMNLLGWREVWVPVEQVSAVGSVQAAVEKQNKHEKSCLLIGELAKSVVSLETMEFHKLGQTKTTPTSMFLADGLKTFTS